MRTVTTIGAMLVLAGCTALPIDMNKVASEVGVDQSSISLAHSCTYAESAPGVGIADFSNAMCVVLTDRITLLKSDWLGQTHGGSPLTMRFDELEGVALVFFLQSAQLQLQYRGRLVVLKLNVDREAIKSVDASIKAAGVKAFEGSYVWNQVFPSDSFTYFPSPDTGFKMPPSRPSSFPPSFSFPPPSSIVMPYPFPMPKPQGK